MKGITERGGYGKIKKVDPEISLKLKAYFYVATNFATAITSYCSSPHRLVSKKIVHE